MLRSLFGPRGEVVTEGWRKMHNEEPHILYFPPDVVRMIKLKMMRWM
jgi:hypothetical protein